MVTYPDVKFLPVAQELLACLCTAAAANPFPPQICSFRPYQDGTPLIGTTLDECCRGVAYVYGGGNAFPSRSGFPSPDGTPVSCGVTWAFQLQMGIWRCAPTGSMQTPPTPEDWTALNLKQFDDFATLRDALCCFLKARPAKSVFVDNSGIINDGPEGGCTGWAMTLMVQI